MKAASVMRNLSLYQFTEKRAEAIATELRKASRLPKGGRGLSAPDVSCLEAAVFALAVAGAERVVDAVSVAVELAGLVDRDGETLGDVIAHAVCNPAVAHTIRHVRVIVESKMGEVTFTDGTVRQFFPAALWRDPLFRPESQGQAFAGRIGHIGGAVLAQLAIDNASDDGAGELVA